MLQLHVPDWPERKEAVRIALRRMSGSMRMCREFPVDERLSGYGRGVCESERGRKSSRDRLSVARKLLAM